MSQRFDPGQVPVQLASTVIVVDDRPTLQVLCLRRRAGSEFVGGMTVFPGGGLDPEDSDPRFESRIAGRSAAEADHRLELERDALAYWVAVARETFEEVGVLLARQRDGGRLSPDVARHRYAVDSGERQLLDVLEEEDLVLDLGEVYDVGRWITPVGAPRRYDTRFFVARMPAGQHAVADDVEAVHAEWRTPDGALKAYRDGELAMLPPTVCVLQILSRFDSVDRLLAAAAAAKGPGDVARIRGADRGPFEVMLPGDDGYDHQDARDTLGWMYDLRQ